MKIRYVVNARIPTPRAHGLQVMKTCEALARAGVEVELVVPRRKNAITADPFVYYGLTERFTITYLPTIDLIRYRVPFAFSLQTLAFTYSLARYVKRATNHECLYVRGEVGWLLPRFSRATFIWENHIRLAKRAAEARALARARAVVVVTERYKEDLVREHGYAPERILVAPDGVDLAEFSRAPAKEEARKRLMLSHEKKLAVYVGSDLSWKGLSVLKEAAGMLPREFDVIFVGPITSGGEGRYMGERPHGEVPLWLAAADVLVLTGDAVSETARHYTSPLKLFEYMAARRPIVATDLPSFREVLSEETATFAPPGDARALAGAIERAARDLASAIRAESAFQAVERYSWDERARRILAFIGTVIRGKDGPEAD
jgi:glycosyltransferase involved in cell wall biosynthesis